MACAVHCLLVPVALVLLPAVTVAWLRAPVVEFILLALVALLGTTSLALGYRCHLRWCPLGLGAVGLAALGASLALPEGSRAELMLRLLAAGFLLTAFALDRRQALCSRLDAHPPLSS